MHKNIIKTMIKKEFKVILTSKKVWIPMVIVPLLLCIIIPTFISYMGIHSNMLVGMDSDMERMAKGFAENFPEGDMKEQYHSLLSDSQQLTYLFINFLLIPFFLMSAIINSTTISSNSFAGEKERKTLENLLFSPISIKELFISKTIASFIPPIILTFVSFILCAIFVNFITYTSFNFVLFLTPTWLIMMFWLVPILVLFNTLLNIIISSKVKTYQEAQQFGGILILPVVAIVVSQSTGLFFLDPFLIFVIGVGLLILNFLLLKFMTKFTDRSKLFENQIH